MATYMSLQQIIDSDQSINQDRLKTVDGIIRALVITRQGTIPGSRDFGLPGLFQDAPMPAAVNVFASELAEALSKYAPDVRLNRVEHISSGIDGAINIRIYIGGA